MKMRNLTLATDLSPEAAPHVGLEIRELRKARGMTLSELSSAVGRSIGWLSQIERGVTDPAIRDLRRLAEYFGLSLGFFFRNDDAPADERGWIVRAAARHPLGTGEDGLIEEMLSPDLGGRFELVRSVFAPNAVQSEPVHRATEEAGYVVQGELDLELDGTWFRLSAGDSFRFEAIPFRWRNPGDEDAVVIWVIAPPVY